MNLRFLKNEMISSSVNRGRQRVLYILEFFNVLFLKEFVNKYLINDSF